MTEFTPAVPTQIHRLTLPTVPERVIDLVAPVNPDAFLDDPAVRQRYQADNYMPYWPIIWPAGLLLAAKILTDSATPPRPPEGGGRVLDMGCGLGLAGIAAALVGWQVTFTDYDRQAVHFAAHNARRNGVPAERLRAVCMDWRQPLEEEFSFIIASDVLYERRLHALLLSALGKLLAPGGTAWIADPQRTSAEDFPLHAVAAGFKVAMENLEGLAATGGKQVAQLYVVRRG